MATLATRRPFLMTWPGTVSCSLLGVAALYIAGVFVDNQAYGLIALNAIVLLLLVGAVGSFGITNSLLLWRPSVELRVGGARAALYAGLGLALLFVADALSGGVGGHAFFGRGELSSIPQSREGLACLVDGERQWLAFVLSAVIVWAFSAALELCVRSWVERTGARKTATRQTGIAVGLMAAGVLGMSILAEVQSCPRMLPMTAPADQADAGVSSADGSRLC